MTTLTRGQCAPLLHRSLPVLRSTLPYSARQRHVFLRDDLQRGRADYFVNLNASRIELLRINTDLAEKVETYSKRMDEITENAKLKTVKHCPPR